MSSFAPQRASWQWGVVDVMIAQRANRRRVSALVRTQRARWRLAALLVAVAFLSALLGGCAGGASGQPRLTEHDYEADLARDQAIANRHMAKSSDTAPHAERAEPAALEAATDTATAGSILAEQSQRDVDLLLAARRDKAAAPGTPTDGGSAASSDAPQREPLAPRRVVVWNEPVRAAPAISTSPKHAQPDSAAAATSPTTDSVQPTTAPDDLQASGGPGLQSDRMKQLAVDLARELYASGAYSDQPLRELVVIAAMNMVDADRRLDPAAIPDLTEAERTVLATLQAFFADLNASLESSAPDEVPQRVADAASKLRTALVHEPQLKLPTIALCTRVNGFGDYSTFDRYAFTAGAEQKAIVYLEIGDFVSEINENAEFVTELSQQLTIYHERDGIPVWKDDWQSAVDVARNQRKDFFTVQVITLPKNLSVGRYILKARVRDEKSRAEAETSLGFEIGVN